MMNDYEVKKILARDGEPEIINSSSEELDLFLRGVRPDLIDPSVLAIKFIVGPEWFEEQTNWFVNKSALEDFDAEKRYAEDPALVTDEYGTIKIDGSIPPTILFLYKSFEDVVDRYWSWIEKFTLERIEAMTEEGIFEKFAIYLAKNS